MFTILWHNFVVAFLISNVLNRIVILDLETTQNQNTYLFFSFEKVNKTILVKFNIQIITKTIIYILIIARQRTHTLTSDIIVN